MNPLLDYSQPYMEGWHLFWFGGDIDDCPYPADTWKELERREGWRAAEQINEGNTDED